MLRSLARAAIFGNSASARMAPWDCQGYLRRIILGLSALMCGLSRAAVSLKSGYVSTNTGTPPQRLTRCLLHDEVRVGDDDLVPFVDGDEEGEHERAGDA